MSPIERANPGLNNMMRGLAPHSVVSPDGNWASLGDALAPSNLKLKDRFLNLCSSLTTTLLLTGCAGDGLAPNQSPNTQPPQGSIQIQPSQGRENAQYFGVPTLEPLKTTPDVARPLPLPTSGPNSTPQGPTQKGDPKPDPLPTRSGIKAPEKPMTIDEYAFPPGFETSILINRMKAVGIDSRGSGADPGPDDPKNRFKLQNIPECEAQISTLISRARQSPAQYHVADTTCATHEGNSYYFSARYISDRDTLEVSVSSTNLPTSQSWYIQNTNEGTTLWMSSYAIFSTPQGPVRDTGFNPVDDTAFVLGLVQKSTGQKIDTVRTSVFNEGPQYGMHSNYNKYISAYEAARVSGKSPQVASMDALKSIYSMGIVANRVAVLNGRNVPIKYMQVNFQLADNRIVTPNELKAKDKITAIFAMADVSAKK